MAADPLDRIAEICHDQPHDALTKIAEVLGFPESSLTLDANDVKFLAARLRRLFAHFALPLPKDAAADDARLIGIAGSAIGMLLTRWETFGPDWYAVMSEAAPGINKALRRADVADEYADKCRRDGYTGVEVIPLYAHADARHAAAELVKKQENDRA